MKIFKVLFHQHNALRKSLGWLIVLAPNAEDALSFAYRDVINKVPGYAYHIKIKELCPIKEGKCAYVEGDFILLSLAMYND